MAAVVSAGDHQPGRSAAPVSGRGLGPSGGQLRPRRCMGGDDERLALLVHLGEAGVVFVEQLESLLLFS